MANIRLLSEETIDKIAAGEVIERPASIVKELLENAIDAGADAVTVEIKEGGLSFIRVTDNGCGIEAEDIRTAFLRHATSKITTADDLDTVESLGFRGEALSSIAAVSNVELLTKTKGSLLGNRYVIEGAKEVDFEEIGIPNGTSIIVRNLFFNTPVRRKFLKSAITEAGYVSEVCEHIALSRPDISVKFVNSGSVKFHTSGSGDLKELIYRIYGRDVSREIIPINEKRDEIALTGYLGKPVLNRSNRNFEIYFVNGRFVKSKVVQNACEEGYRQYLMQHKFPFLVLNINIDPLYVDVNVHPTKLEVRFSNNELISDFISSAVAATLKVREMIPEAVLSEEPKEVALDRMKSNSGTDISSLMPDLHTHIASNTCNTSAIEADKAKPSSIINCNTEEPDGKLAAIDKNDYIDLSESVSTYNNKESRFISSAPEPFETNRVMESRKNVSTGAFAQQDLFEEKLLSFDALQDYKIIGQVFDTYWIIEYKDKLLIMDQHAAHEKVKYEALIKGYENRSVCSQQVNPPVVINLTMVEYNLVNENLSSFEALGFELESFKGTDILLRAIPLDLYGRSAKDMFVEIVDELADTGLRKVSGVICEKIASMACKAAVKGNTNMTEDEARALIAELMTLDNPYNCPHGRPTVFTMSKQEIEKKFKRIVN